MFWRRGCIALTICYPSAPCFLFISSGLKTNSKSFILILNNYLNFIIYFMNSTNSKLNAVRQPSRMGTSLGQSERPTTASRGAGYNKNIIYLN